VFAAAVTATACFAPLDSVAPTAAQVRLSIVSADPSTAAEPAPPANAVVDLRIDGLSGRTRVSLYQAIIRQDTLTGRMNLAVDLTPCLDFREQSPACPVFVTVRLRLASGLAYDSVEVGPLTVRPATVVEVPTLSFRATARLVAVDTLVRLPVGRTATPRVTVLDASDRVLNGRTLAYRSFDPTIATVDAAGVIRAIAPGVTTVEASRETRSALVQVLVPAVEALTVTPAALTLVSTQSGRLSATVVVAPGRSQRLVYSSSDPAIATVDSTGLVTSLRAGSVNIAITPQADPAERRLIPVTVEPFRSAVSWRRGVTGDLGPLPNNVAGLYGTRLDSLVAVGCTFISRFDGRQWRQELTPTFCPLAITGTSMQDMWALGTQIWRFSAGAWTRDASFTPVNQVTDAVTVAGSTFAVGLRGQILQRDAAGWRAVTSPTTQTLRRVHAISPSLAYAVGDSGTVVRYDGTRWSALIPPNATLNWTAVHVRSPTQVYITGSRQVPTYLQETYVFDGTAWQLVPVADNNGMGSFFTLGTDFYIAGYNGVIMRLENGRFALSAPREGWVYYANAWSNGQTVMLAGSYGHSALYNGTTTQRLTSIATYDAIWATGPNAIYAGGYRGFIDFWDGATWTPIRGDNRQSLQTMWGDATGTVWAGGTYGTMVRIRGRVVDSVAAPTGAMTTAIFGFHPDSVWAVTDAAEVMRWTGGSWTSSTRLGAALRGLHGTSTRNLFAVGDNGYIARYNGSTWSQEPSGVTSRLWSVYAPDSTTAFAVGDSAVLQRIGGNWRVVTPTAGTPFFRWIKGSNGRDIYAGGCSNSRVWRYDGVSWLQDPAITTSACDVSGLILPGGGVFSGGTFRQVLVGTGPLGNAPGNPP
jgi:hypothetical protein